MAVEPTRRAVVVLPAAVHLRRVLDAGSWVLLEELLSRSAGDTELSLATASIRDLAASLGVSKNTVGRAVERLRSHGLLIIDQARASGGVFASTTYRISVPADMFDLTTDAAPVASAPATDRVAAVKRPARRTPPAFDSQLSLLDV